MSSFEMQEAVVKYEQQLNDTLKSYFEKGFRIAKAKVNCMVWWKDEEKQKEVLVVLPRLLLVRCGFFTATSFFKAFM